MTTTTPKEQAAAEARLMALADAYANAMEAGGHDAAHSHRNRLRVELAAALATQPAPAVSGNSGLGIPSCGGPLCSDAQHHPLCASAVSAEPVAWEPGTWYEAKSVDDMQRFFCSRLPAIREAAREHGYAVGVHGSERRDFDLIAAPWRDGASDAETLAKAVAVAACGIARSGPYDFERKPLGRLAVSIPICWTSRHGVPSDGHIDLSVMPAAPTPPAEPSKVEALLRVAPHFPGGETPEPSLSALIYRYYRLYFDQPKADDFAKQYLAALHHQPSAQMQGESE